jgi:hypothetical protein
MLKWNIPESNEEPLRITKRLAWIITALCLGAFSFSYFSWLALFSLMVEYRQTLSLWSI